ncbi:hypothetical protein [Candidatus Pantoea edessiphila]|nr:hypothetical protein [Candidatus Pantoea edessiphila]
MGRINDLLQFILGFDSADFISYQNIFLQYFDLDPLDADLTEFYKIAIN